ncbi:MAG: hypothetical protein WBC91_18550 [Phototrophicaceae bacterium]
MRALFFALDWAAQPAYVLLAVIVIWYFYRLLQARSEMSATYFELERDLARRRQANAITTILIAFEVAVLLFGVQVRAVPFLEAERDMDTIVVAQEGVIEDIEFSTPTPASVDGGGLNIEVGPPLDEDTDIIVLTPTPTPTPVGTIIPNAPPVEGCEDPRAQLQVPANGQRVFSPLLVRGTAFTDNFKEAKLEISGPTTLGDFLVVTGGIASAQQVTELGNFVPGPYEEGAYQFRLMVFDITNTLVSFCQVTIFISDPPNAATATPSAGG